MAAAASRPWSFRQTIGYLNWIFNPFQRLDVVGVYDLLSTGSPTSDALYLNLGYWEEATDLDQACRALAMLVGETSGMGPGSSVLDVGFGFADQDMLWVERLRPDRILGLNITASQIEVARRRVEERGLSDRIDLREGSATEMPMPDACVDQVVALECAFHFRTRERFFAEAWRVLKPGGRLVTADIIPMPGVSGWRARLQHWLSWWMVASKFSIPAENCYTRPTYHALLALEGFEQIEIRSIRDAVYRPLHEHLAASPGPLRRLHPLAGLAGRLALRRDADSVYRGLDYILAVARKPG